MWSELAGSGVILLGGEAFLAIGERVRLGGFGYGTIQSANLVGGALPQDLRMGYGGVFLNAALSRTGPMDLDGELLLGAGNAQVHARPIGNQLGSDNFLVVEPRLGLEFPRRYRLRGTVELGYRFVAGVQDLPLVAAGDLRSWTLSVQVMLGGVR